MPLPVDNTLSLLGYSKPGETSQSRPKQAMIIRMSDKTLNLLESFPQLHFQFCDNPGIHIGDTFFPVTSVQGSSPHDLYLRTSSAAKKNTPLKLYANVIGNFTVERQLDDRISDKVRASTIDAEKERSGRTTKFIETPSDLQNTKRKKDPAPMFINNKNGRPVPPATTQRASPAPSSTQRSKESLQALRSRMIKFIAIKESTPPQDVVQAVGGKDCTESGKRDILALLAEIAEPVPTAKSSKKDDIYQLKNKSYLEVRPYEYPNLKDSERLSIARKARLALRTLRIPESDSVWGYMQQPNNTSTQSSIPSRQIPNGNGSSKVAQSEPPKRGITSTAAKEKKVKVRKDGGEIMIKNEGLLAAMQQPSTSTSNRGDEMGRMSPSLKPITVRRPPGSGFRKGTSTGSPDLGSRSPLPHGKSKLPESSVSNRTSVPSQTTRPSTSAISSRKVEKLRDKDYAGSDSERSDRTRDREWNTKSKEADRGERERERREKEREQERKDIERSRERERARRREATLESDRDREPVRKISSKPRDWPGEWEEGERSDDSLRPVKRKNVSREEEEYDANRSRVIQKRRKMEPPASLPPPPAVKRDLSLPKKPDVELPPRNKTVKVEHSPPSFPRINKHSTTASHSKPSAPPARPSPSNSSEVSTSKSRIGAKSRRMSTPVYTSSEDEGEIRPAPKSSSVATTNNNRPVETHTNLIPDLPAHERKALRARYDTDFVPYVGVYHKLTQQKQKIQSLVRMLDKTCVDSVTDSGDDEFLGIDEVERLTSEYKGMHEKLVGIQQIFGATVPGSR